MFQHLRAGWMKCALEKVAQGGGGVTVPGGVQMKVGSGA